MKKIQFLNDDKIRLESIDKFNDSIFSEQYIQAYRIIREILKKSKEIEAEDNQFQKDNSIKFSAFGNIVAFLGDRGSGKSSLMHSVEKSLIEYQKTTQKDEKYRLLEEDKNLQFASLGSFDASTFETGEDIFDNVLLQMFSNYESYLRNNNISSRADFELRDFQQKLIEIFTDFQNLNRREETGIVHESSAMAELKRYTTSYDVRKKFAEVVKKYRTMISNGRATEPYLILMLDDMDMNTEYGFRMLGQIERYLTVPGIIVLITGKYEQLEILGEKYFINIFPTINKKMKKSQVEYARKTAREYLEKTIPIQRRVYLPEFHNNFLRSYDELKVEKEDTQIRNALLGKIGRRTQIFFYASKNKRHFLEPSSLRGTNDYYSFLNELKKLKDIDKSKVDEKEYQRKENNLRFFQDIYNRFIFEYLDTKQIDIFRKVCAMDAFERNTYLKYYMSEQEDVANGDASVSYGDLLYSLYRYTANQPENKKLGHCILLLYNYFFCQCVLGEPDAYSQSILKQGLGRSILGDWGKYIFHTIEYKTINSDIDSVDEETDNETPLEIYQGIQCYLGYREQVKIKGKSQHAKNQRDNDPDNPQNEYFINSDIGKVMSGKDAASIISWFKEEHPHFLEAIELIMFFWENLVINEDVISYQQIQFYWKEYGEAEKSWVRLNLINDRGDFNIMAFVMNSYNYKEYLDAIHESLIMAINPNLPKDEQIEIKSFFREHGLYQKYQSWEEQYKFRMPIPFHQTDIYYHLLKHLTRRMLTSGSRRIDEKDILKYLGLFYQEISKLLGELDKFYIHNTQNNGVMVAEEDTKFKKAFDDCPFIKLISQWTSGGSVLLAEEAVPSKENSFDGGDTWMIYKKRLGNIFKAVAFSSLDDKEFVDDYYTY